jgi:hypothetical protein
MSSPLITEKEAREKTIFEKQKSLTHNPKTGLEPERSNHEP